MTLSFSNLSFELKCTECNHIVRERTEYTSESVGKSFDLILLYLLHGCPKCNLNQNDKNLLERYERLRQS